MWEMETTGRRRLLCQSLVRWTGVRHPWRNSHLSRKVFYNLCPKHLFLCAVGSLVWYIPLHTFSIPLSTASGEWGLSYSCWMQCKNTNMTISDHLFVAAVLCLSLSLSQPTQFKPAEGNSVIPPGRREASAIEVICYKAKCVKIL